jgi:glutamate dehydrogenase
MAQDDRSGCDDVLRAIEAELVSAPPVGSRQNEALFARLLVDSVGRDAIADYDAATLAAFVREAFQFIVSKPPGAPRVRVVASDLPEGAHSHRVATIQTLNDDIPFLVDSIIGEVRAKGLSPILVVHPIFKTRRDSDGVILEIAGGGDNNWRDGSQESYIGVILDPLDEMLARELEVTLPAVLAEVRAAVADWRPMLAMVDEAVTGLEQQRRGAGRVGTEEGAAFCRWIRDGNFTLLGARWLRASAAGVLEPTGRKGLGILRPDVVAARSVAPAGLAATTDAVVISKLPELSHVHRRVALDHVLVSLGSGGEKARESLELVGLLTSSAYTQPPGSIPILRSKVASVIARSGHLPQSHDGKALTNLLNTFPRDELFQIDERQLSTWAQMALDLELRPRVRLLTRLHTGAGTASSIVYVPRDRFSTTLRERIGQRLAEAWGGTIMSFTPYFTEGPLVRIHFILAVQRGAEVDAAGLEAEVAALTRSWEDQLARVLADEDEVAAPVLSAKYRRAFSAGYQETFTASRALEDIRRIERLGPDRAMAIDFYRTEDEGPSRVRAAIYRFDMPIPLSERVPVLENLGFSVIDERSYRVVPKFDGQNRIVALHDMSLETADGSSIELAGIDAQLEVAFLAVCSGRAENDAFNRLVLAAGTEWREAALLRSYAAYMRQMRSPHGPRYIADTLLRHAGMTRDLLELFKTRFDPALALDAPTRAESEAAVRAKIDAGLALVTSLDEDRILRQLVNLVTATLRTNFFQRGPDGAAPATIACKLSSREIDGLPEPRPYREIWVHSPRVEGVHLRFAPIARGGIRWSDRAQDFRTEVLGLIKAQQVKNAVIVPQGAKGGFLPKQLPRSGVRDDVAREGLAAYRIFIGALLDLTDNLDGGAVRPPPQVVRYDGDDPYFVVAADKGTATFSDTANEIAAARGFWLGDAFASGGSAGYDHKKMGITARGAWECVKRHFREIGRDIQSEPFTVVGVGDMSGDVFGNGMLLSPATRLVAAFDHRDIFIDPAPDPAASLAERRRLFNLPRSSWQDYDKRLISAGGGIFPRTVKSVAVTPQMQRALGIEAISLPPSELIRAVLKAPADLIWLGGIGTYIRAGEETEDHVGDRANDGVRVSAGDVRAKVVGEGANLGITQRGRIELARSGVRLNTDFIDNSAGVNTSDQEVNIKIALAPAVTAGQLAETDRRALLASMTDAVAAGSMRNNHQQSLALSLAESRGASDLGYLQRLMQVLEGRQLLDRRLEFLPTNAEIAQRQAAGAKLTRPELAVLLSYAKIALTSDLLATGVPELPAGADFLAGYFPDEMRDRYADSIAGHRLRREIIVTLLTNAMINRGGPAFVVRLVDETGQQVGEIAEAFLAARQALGLSALWRQLDALDGQVAWSTQLMIFRSVQDVMLAATRWFARNARTWPSVEHDVRAVADQLRSDRGRPAEVDQLHPSAGALASIDPATLPASLRASVASLDILVEAPAVAALVRDSRRSPRDASQALQAARAGLRLGDLEAQAANVPVYDHYDRLAVDDALASLRGTAERMALVDLRIGRSAQDAEAASTAGSTAIRAMLDDALANGALSASRLTVLARRIADTAGSAIAAASAPG